MGLCGEHIQKQYPVYLTRFQTYKIALPPPNKTKEGREPQTPAAKSLHLSIFKKKPTLGFGIDRYFGPCFKGMLRSFCPPDNRVPISIGEMVPSRYSVFFKTELRNRNC
jgi:hypothetical protein